ALGVLATAAALSAQLATTTLLERSRAVERLTALEAAANVLEAARARPWADLTPTWAAGQRLPDFVLERLSGVTLTVRVEPEPDRPRLKRVTVEVHWTHRDGHAAPAAELTALFADRTGGGS